MKRIEMTPDHKLIWDTLTKEQIKIITIFIVAYYDENEVEPGHEALKDALLLDVVDASNYLSIEDYIIFRSINDYQKLAVYTNYVNYEEKYCAELMADYSVDETVAAAGYDYTVFVLHNLFTDTNLLNFRFFQN
jgi:hypothetical protein